MECSSRALHADTTRHDWAQTTTPRLDRVKRHRPDLAESPLPVTRPRTVNRTFGPAGRPRLRTSRTSGPIAPNSGTATRRRDLASKAILLRSPSPSSHPPLNLLLARDRQQRDRALARTCFGRSRQREAGDRSRCPRQPTRSRRAAGSCPQSTSSEQQLHHHHLSVNRGLFRGRLALPEDEGAGDGQDAVVRGETGTTDQESRSAAHLAAPILTAMDVITASCRSRTGRSWHVATSSQTLVRPIGRSIK